MANIMGVICDRCGLKDLTGPYYGQGPAGWRRVTLHPLNSLGPSQDEEHTLCYECIKVVYAALNPGVPR